MTPAEELLVADAQRGDRAAFEELVRRSSRLVFARLYLETGDTHQAEDLLQETLLIAFRSLSQLTEPAKFRTWLLKIAQNTAIDAARRNSRQKRGSGATASKDVGLLAAHGPSAEDAAVQHEMRQKVLSVLRGLPEEYRLPLTLRYVAGADYQAIQLQMGLTNGSLRGLLHRGLQMLRDELKKDLGEDFSM